jgi:hypothetical protein
MNKVYYRISDNSYKKIKIPGTNKQICLINFLSNFQNFEINIIADNVNDNTFDFIKNLSLQYQNVNIERTNYSNAGSFNYCLDLALMNDFETVNYFVEDDYIHRENSELCILEGLEKSDYVTLFDHPDKYQSEYQYGETCKVFKSKNYIWKTTISTCMTFAVKTKTLKKDYAIFKHYLHNQQHPNDHLIFCDLKSKGRTLSLPLPGFAYHTDLTYFKDKKISDDLIDSWVLKESQNFCLIYLNKYKNLDLEIEKNENYKQNLSMLDIVLSNY